MDLYMFIYQICTAFNLREINKLYPAALDIYPLISFVKLSYFKQLLTNTIENIVRLQYNSKIFFYQLLWYAIHCENTRLPNFTSI